MVFAFIRKFHCHLFWVGQVWLVLVTPTLDHDQGAWSWSGLVSLTKGLVWSVFGHDHDQAHHYRGLRFSVPSTELFEG